MLGFDAYDRSGHAAQEADVGGDAGKGRARRPGCPGLRLNVGNAQNSGIEAGWG